MHIFCCINITHYVYYLVHNLPYKVAGFARSWETIASGFKLCAYVHQSGSYEDSHYINPASLQGKIGIDRRFNPITCQVNLESVCLFPNSFQGQVFSPWSGNTQQWNSGWLAKCYDVNLGWKNVSFPLFFFFVVLILLMIKFQLL